MEIREFYGKEAIKYKKLSVSLFRCGNMELADEVKYAEALEKEEQNPDEGFFRLGFFDGDRLCASIRSDSFLVNIDGQEVGMGGIGGVVSDFNNPRKGLIKELFQKGFEMMREKGQIVSHLYPFKVNYYRQYGYEVCCKHNLWKIPVEYIADDCLGRYVYYDGSDRMKQDVMDIYQKFSRNYNMSVVKDERHWEVFFKTVLPYEGKHFSYLHYTGDEADAFMSYNLITSDDRPQDLNVDNIWFTSYQGLRGIMSYFVSQRPYADRVLVNIPVNVDLSACNEIAGGWGKRSVICNTIYDGTTRIVDVEKMLQVVKYRGSGSLCVQIMNDSYCPWNNDCFSVAFGSKTTVTRGGKPDITMDINAFSAMILGTVGFEDGFIFPHVEVYGNQEQLEKMFYKKNQYIDVHF